MISISFSFREVDVWRWSNRFGSMTTKPVHASRASFSQANLARASLDSGTQQQDPSKQTQCFTYRELATATNNFRLESMIGHGGFGSVFKGKLVFPPGQVTLNIYHLEL
ncbi:unnamed protein product [Brassica oleracea]